MTELGPAVRIDHWDSTMIITINRPERRNAVDLDTAQALLSAFQQFDADPDSHVAVLTGTGGDAFCSGSDMVAVASGERKPLMPGGMFAPIGPVRLDLSKPVIAAIEGAAVGGGAELAAWCDLRVAGQAAFFGMYNRRFGIPSCDLGSVHFPRLIGYGRAMDLVLTGKRIDADEALQIGLVNRLVDEGSALDIAVELADQIGQFPQVALRNDRRALIDSSHLDRTEAIAREIELALLTIESGELLDGAIAFADGAGRHGNQRSGPAPNSSLPSPRTGLPST